jgi:DNA-binding MarR family transcriptional regulator
VQQQLKPFKLTTSQFNVLRILRGQKGKPMSASAIQERMIHRTSNVTRIIEKLVEKNWVTRENKATNRRMIDVKLTEEGLQLLRDTDNIVVRAYKAMAKLISESEAQDIGDLLDKLREKDVYQNPWLGNQ